MGRSPCCDKIGLKKGPWTPEEDQKLLAYIEENGNGSWRALPSRAGLQRCGKSCRLRWTNYLRPDIKRGKFSAQEEQAIIQLHALLGNRWSAIATHLPKRTDNEIKNYWNTHLKKRLVKMGIDPVTHKPKNDAVVSSDGPSKNAANLSHMAQWESARLEAEARLVRESKLRSRASASNSAPGVAKAATPWISGGWTKSNKTDSVGIFNPGFSGDLASPTSTLTFSENGPPVMRGLGLSSMPVIDFVGTSSSTDTGVINDIENSLSLPTNQMSLQTAWTSENLRGNNGTIDNCFIRNVVDEGFTNLLLNESNDRTLSDSAKESENSGGADESTGSGSDHYHEDNKTYWNNILNLVNSSPPDSPMF